MNEVIDVLLKRRSVRRFLKDAVPREFVNQILQTASWAPSSMNSQPWHFSVIENQGLLDTISFLSNEIRVEMGVVHPVLDVDADSPDAHVFYKAPVVIVVSGKKNTLSSDPNVDCAIAAFSAFISATSLGLGACLVDLYNNFGKIVEAPSMIGLNEEYMPYYGIAIGYRDESFSIMAPPRKTDNISFLGNEGR